MTQGRSRWSASGPLAAAVAVALVGCSGGGGAAPTSPSSEVAAEGTSTGTSPGTATPTPTVPDGEAFVPGLSDEVVVQTTPVSGGGDRPVLAWEAVDGADDYVVMVHTDDDAPYWSWSTSETHVRVGLTDRPDGAPGPRVAAGMTWVVVARDGDGLPIATSPRRPIAP